MANISSLKPFTKNDPRIGSKPKGARSFKTNFRLACKEVAEKLMLGQDPDAVHVQLIASGIRQALAGNYPFWKDIVSLLWGNELKQAESGKKIEISFYEENPIMLLKQLFSVKISEDER